MQDTCGKGGEKTAKEKGLLGYKCIEGMAA